MSKIDRNTMIPLGAFFVAAMIIFFFADLRNTTKYNTLQIARNKKDIDYQRDSITKAINELKASTYRIEGHLFKRGSKK